MVPWSPARESMDLLCAFGSRIPGVVRTPSNLFNFAVLTELTSVFALLADRIVAPVLTMLVSSSKSRLREELRG